jgi:preprotein translocase subunit SecY
MRTLGLLICYRIGFQIPIPGMSPEFLSQTASKGVFGLLSTLSGGRIGQTTVFALGIMPYISASIIFSMLTKISPTLEAVSKEGAAGYKKINQWTRLTAVPIALVQGLFIYTGIFAREPAMIEPSMRSHPILLACVVVMSLVAGAMIVMWIGELITEYGLGNGASIIIMAGIIADIPTSLMGMSSGDDFYNTLVFWLGMWAVIVTVIVYITKGARRVPIQYARLTRGRRVYGGQKHFLPLKINMAGVMPIIFASILFVIPGVISEAFGWSWLRSVFNDPRGFVYVVSYIALIFSFCFFWNRLMFQPEDIANNLREHGSFVPGIRPGAKTAEYLGNIVTRITLAGAAFLAAIAVLPAFITKGSPMPPTMQYFLGGTSVLIVVGVALELVDRLNAQLVMRNYGGFMKGGTSPGWTRKERA